jgi:signal transduction histidine kinase
VKRRSLKVRLLIGAAIAIFAALAIAWVAMTFLFSEALQRRVEQELRRDALQLVAGVSIDAAGAVRVADRLSDPRFETPASGLFWQVGSGANAERSRSLWDQTLPESTTADARAWRTRFAAGPFGHRLFVLERIVQPEGAARGVLVQLALDEDEIVQARAEFGNTLALFLVILWLVLAGAAWAQVALGLRPLAAMRRELAGLRRNAAERLSEDYPVEIEPLTRAINDLAAAREGDVKRARQRAADLAHGMKTPLAALAAQSRLIRDGQIQPQAAADGLDRAIAAAAAAVETELARARAAASRHREAKASPLAVTQGLILVLERTEKGMRLDYAIDIPEGLRVPVADDDLSEILGPLLENAVRFARRRIRVVGEAKDGGVELGIEDDGPGMDNAEAAEAVVRGVRLDQASHGHGLGLAIARDLVEATSGAIGLGVSPLGGLKVALRWNPLR